MSTGFWLYDLVGSICLMMIVGYFMNENSQTKFYNNFTSYWSGKNKYNTITFSSSDKDVSQRYRALMHYISSSNDPTIKNLFEIELKKYNHRIDDDEYHSTIYRVSQAKKFRITDEIEGNVYWSSKDKTEYNGKISYIEYQNLEIMSKTKTLKDLISWVEQIEKDYKNYLKNKMLDTHTLVEVTWNTKEDCIEAFYTPWESNVTFENRFFTGKKEILQKINFFLNNEQWYKDRGIPYTLGILLWGEPGCGKTGFIKALMNLTKRHGVDVKLNSSFEMDHLKEVICDDQITKDIIIPQKNRILLFEDIDAMGDVVKDRDLPKDSSEIEIEKKITEALRKSSMNKNRRRNRNDNLDTFCTVDKLSSKGNNNLSCFLNIIDGLNECPGRIIIMTTNKPEYLDKALIRPGRIDIKIHMAKASLTDINDILNFYWSTNTMYTIKESWSEQLSHAELISCCRQSNDINETLINIERAITKKTFDGSTDKIKNGDTVFISNSEKSNTESDQEQSSAYEDSSKSSQTSQSNLSVVSNKEEDDNTEEENDDNSEEDDNDTKEDDNDSEEDDEDYDQEEEDCDQEEEDDYDDDQEEEVED
jgi:SpoVK/Ycf46/Vps4 family AAA+-type ATPase